MGELEALYVFIDSSVYIGKNYWFGHPSFVALKESVTAGRVVVLITDVTIQEVKAHIKEDVSRSIQAITKARSAAKILRNIPDYRQSVIFGDIDGAAVERQIIEAFDAYLSEINAQIVPVSMANTEFVFDSYFKCRPPFGRGKKKDEFPDAFVISSLNEWAEEWQKDVYVLSNDSDMHELGDHYPRLESLESLEAFLDIVTSFFESLAPLALRLLHENIELIKDELEEKFKWLGFVIQDQDGSVNDVRVVSIGDFGTYLIALKSNKQQGVAAAHFELTSLIAYEADVSYDNYDTAVYDNEDKVAIPWETIERVVDGSVIVQADLQFSFSMVEPIEFKFLDFDLHTPKDVWMSVEGGSSIYQ